MQEKYRVQFTATAVCWAIMLLFWLVGLTPEQGFLYGLYGALLTVIHAGVKSRVSPDVYQAGMTWVPIQIVTGLVIYLTWGFNFEKTLAEIFLDVVTRVAIAIPTGFLLGCCILAPRTER